MTMDGPISFLYFDLGKVLLDFDHQKACEQLAIVLGTTAEVIREDVFHSGQQWKYERGEITTLELHRWLCDKYSVEATLDDVAHAAGNIFEPMDDTIQLARELAAGGYRLGILSNTCDCHWEYCLERPFPWLEQLFPVHALSFRLGAMKPEPEIYAAAARLVEVPPANIFFVDDRPENVEGAVRAGFDAVVFHSAGQLRRDLRLRGIAV